MAKYKKNEPVVLTKEQMIEKALDGYHNDKLSYCDPKIIPSPSRMFEIGEEVQIGHITKCIVHQILDGGKAYLIERYDYSKTGEESIEYVVWHWFHIDKKEGAFNNNAPRLTSDWRLPQMWKTSIQHFIYSMSHHGLVCDPRFQREYVWVQKDVDALFDAMFDHMDIGMFIVFSSLGYLHKNSTDTATYRNLDGETITIEKNNDYTESIIDGQQRLTTIFRFMDNKIQYRGMFFKDLHPKDQHHLTEFQINVVQYKAGSCSEKDLYRAFLLCNTGGVPILEEHIAKVRNRYQQLLEE